MYVDVGESVDIEGRLSHIHMFYRVCDRIGHSLRCTLASENQLKLKYVSVIIIVFTRSVMGLFMLLDVRRRRRISGN